MGCSPGLGLATRAIHAGTAPDPATGARAVPIYHSNGFAFEDLAHGSELFALDRAGFAYGRSGNPTVAAFERRMADLEGGAAGIAAASGQSAMLMLLTALCRAGDEVVAGEAVFGGTVGLLRRFEERYGIRTRAADCHDPGSIARAITPCTRAIFIESVMNPTGDVVDVPAIAAVARAARVPLIVDSTLATPALQRPIALGADVVWHSASKFICGHGTAIGGVIVDAGNTHWIDDRYPLLTEPFADYDGVRVQERYPAAPFAAACRLVGMRELGPCLSPTNAFLMLTGLETLPLRMARHAANGLALATHLAAHPAVAAVSHPGLPAHPRHNLAAAMLPAGAGPIFTITLAGGRSAAERVLPRLKITSHLVNIGEARSLVAHPETTTHRNVGPAIRAALGIGPGTLRLSVGLESIGDLVADWDQALAA
jgi:O-acetylhomoserine/O-acetylserine sulfhydrylase-like pyridoxal-dependent enzyme